MIVNSNEVRGVATLGRGAKAELQEIVPAPLQGVPVVSLGERGRTRSATASAAVVNVSPALGPSSYALRSDIDFPPRDLILTRIDFPAVHSGCSHL
jgi:hypothetical protein